MTNAFAAHPFPGLGAEIPAPNPQSFKIILATQNVEVNEQMMWTFQPSDCQDMHASKWLQLPAKAAFEVLRLHERCAAAPGLNKAGRQALLLLGE